MEESHVPSNSCPLYIIYARATPCCRAIRRGAWAIPACLLASPCRPMEKLLDEAVAMNDDLFLFKKVVGIYDHSGKLDKTEELFEKMVKRFKTDTDVWVMYATFLMKHERLEKARTVLDRALKSLPVSLGLDIMSASAQLEMKHGEAERGKTLYEKLLKTCPKRIDLLFVYVDALVKLGDIEGARAVLERASREVKKTKKLRSIYVKFLDFETRHGTADQREAVRAAGEKCLLERME